ncbi:hypothetical protein [Dickeya dadantii]|uniref:hypothetical protein n=1 Tax=Dickeya dadantii TaxID=204038 RepID=UPI001CF1C2CA|nr:hypothetical protein [Dickeya dadantii]
MMIKTGSTEPIVSTASDQRRNASWHPIGMTFYQNTTPYQYMASYQYMTSYQ